ncbi:putative O-linked N-acetylglucosamine transferase, SPINDLY family [Bradyrhizobium sp. ORS 285]|uniref:O-linked N-acetylglucosamine transferase, SPINDLY family protein n=1 Tax=Bradyrhizobium sp. ORS 285 TaxID=115808 RepID=UPI000240B0FF|nr:glycosyltransferase family 41 protein [Bradyrhizobium sp. ORS 285]CCD83596.1 putative O-linked N-acetylglucosamine transferase, SPINDLY family [Bradyrhizobium sp. ORS 285]SMX57225.1 putative O-linked N-acetylglucosamine transferase, SPINDLY family [Bradyrhizobium sp. ORS 285]
MAGNVGSRAFQNARLEKKNRKQAEPLLAAATAAYHARRPAEVRSLCAQVLALLPDHAGALRLLGMAALDSGALSDAAAALARAVEIDPRDVDAHANLGIVLSNLGRHAEARRHQERAVALVPNFAAGWNSLGSTLLRLQEAEPAIAAYERAVTLKPDYADAHCNRGMALLLVDRSAEALQSFDRALALNPRHIQALHGKGLVGLKLRHFDEALAALNAALAIRPDAASVLAERGQVHLQAGRFDQAKADFDAALAREPNLESALLGRAHLGVHQNDVAPAMAACRKVLEQNPSSEAAWTWLGGCYAKQGDIEAALQHFDHALALKPDYRDAIAAKIFALDFLPDADFARQQAVRREWWERIGRQLPRAALASRNRDPERRLVIGYVSADFRNHSAAFTVLPVLRHHDHAQFEVICYSCSARQDEVTARCRAAADGWVDAWQMSDDDLAARIQADGVDILVDLSGHSSGNRLTLFARKPAPIQVTAWGHGTGTGLPTIDYFFADPVTVPAEMRHLFAEQVYDLPAVITTDPLPVMPSTELPMLRTGYVTFGVFNRIDKISDAALSVWGRLMAQLPEARTVVKNSAIDDAFLRDGLVARFVAHGIAADRVICFGSTTREQHVAQFAHVDISLDPFPQNGGVSTWESLQAGVPVLAKLGCSPASRAAAAINTALGLDDWVAADDDGYVAIALKHVAEPARLAQLRAELPARVAGSAAGNVETYTRKVEEAYRLFWRRYCANPG